MRNITFRIRDQIDSQFRISINKRSFDYVRAPNFRRIWWAVYNEVWRLRYSIIHNPNIFTHERF